MKIGVESTKIIVGYKFCLSTIVKTGAVIFLVGGQTVFLNEDDLTMFKDLHISYTETQTK